MQFKNLAKLTKGKIARQTLITYLQKAVEQNILSRKEIGRTTYYKLNFEAPETETQAKWLTFAKQKLTFIPDDVKLI